jgi:hypothetical protein
LSVSGGGNTERDYKGSANARKNSMQFHIQTPFLLVLPLGRCFRMMNAAATTFLQGKKKNGPQGTVLFRPMVFKSLTD